MTSAARERPDSFSDLVYSLQQAVSSQMGSHSSKDLRSGPAVAAPASATESAQQGHHRQKKSTSKVYTSTPCTRCTGLIVCLVLRCEKWRFWPSHYRNVLLLLLIFLCLFVCLSACLNIIKITQKISDELLSSIFKCKLCNKI